MSDLGVVALYSQSRFSSLEGVGERYEGNVEEEG